MASSLFVQRSYRAAASATPSNLGLGVRSSRLGLTVARCNSTNAKTPFNSGPSGPESQRQISSERGQTTQLILPVTAAGLLSFALYWLLSKDDKKEVAHSSAIGSGRTKLQSSSAQKGAEKRDSMVNEVKS